jgi:Glycosyltransferase family 87
MSRRLDRLRFALAVLLFGALPLVALYFVFHNAAGEGKVTDFENAFYTAADAVVAGMSPYVSPDDPVLALGTEYVYPPLIALVSVPLTVLPVEAAGVVVMALLVLAVAATLWLLEVRDWRCYGLAFLWPAVISAIQTGNITIPLALGAALVWRYRSSSASKFSRDQNPRSRILILRTASGVALGLTLAAKLFLWPLGIWLAATRRLAALVVAVVVAAGALVVSWAVIGFAGLVDYPDLLQRVQELEEENTYTIFALALDLGATEELARGLWAVAACAVLVGVVVFARRGDDTRAFVLALAGALACSPIVWLHYFALLLVVVAVAEPRLGPAWFVPLAMYGSTGTFNGTTLQTALTIAAAGLTVAIALRPARPRAVPALSPRASSAGSP